MQGPVIGKILLLINGVLLVAFVAACGGERQPAGGDVTPTSATSATFTPSPVPTVSPDSCDKRARAPEGAEERTLERARGMSLQEQGPSADDFSPWGAPGGTLPSNYSFSNGLRSPGEVAQGETAKLRFALTSNHNEVVDLPLEGVPAYDFAILDSQADEVWRWSRDGSPGDPPNSIRFAPGAGKMLSAEWNLNDRGGDRVPEGIYWIYGVVNFTPEHRIVQGPKLMFVGERPALSELIDVRVEAPDAVQCGEAARLELTMTNVSEGMLPLEFGVNIDDYEVTTSEGEHVWRWWEDKTWPFVGTSRIFKPGESQEYVRYWKLVDSQKPIGSLVPPGEYRVRGFIRAELDYASGSYTEEKVYSDWRGLEVRPRE